MFMFSYIVAFDTAGFPVCGKSGNSVWLECHRIIREFYWIVRELCFC